VGDNNRRRLGGAPPSPLDAGSPPNSGVSASDEERAGEALLAPGITKRLIEEFARMPEPGRRPASELSMITDREKDVLELIGRGLTNAEIATRLTVSPATVKTHVSRLLTKLDARDRTQLVIAAYESGLIVAARCERLPAVLSQWPPTIRPATSDARSEISTTWACPADHSFGSQPGLKSGCSA
jgi:DNA-binding CsgD family transcriptional regulator